MLYSVLGRRGARTAAALDRLARALVDRGVTPDGLSVAALVMGVVAAVLFYAALEILTAAQRFAYGRRALADNGA